MKTEFDFNKAKENGLSRDIALRLKFAETEEELIDIILRCPQAFNFIKETWIEKGKEFDDEKICNRIYEIWEECLEKYDNNSCLNYGYPMACRKLLKQVNYDSKKIEELDRKIDEKIDSKITNPNLEWYRKIKKIKLKGYSLEDIPEEEDFLFVEERVDSYLNQLMYDWRNIYYRDDLPNGMEEIFLKDVDGYIMGKEFINWQYVQDLCREGCTFDELPSYVGLTLEALKTQDYEGLFEIMPEKDYLNAYALDSNFPEEITNNKDIMKHLIQLCDDYEDIDSCYEFMSEELKNDEDLLREILKLECVKDSKIEEIINDKLGINKEDEEYIAKTEKQEDGKENVGKKKYNDFEEFQKVYNQFKTFLKNTKDSGIRPSVITKDGLTLSIQASSFHYCTPREDGLESYEKYEVGFPNQVIEQLKEYAECYDSEDELSDEEYLNSVYPFVPEPIILGILKSHGGIDFEKMEEHEKSLSELKGEKQELDEKSKEAVKLMSDFILLAKGILGK